MAAFSYLRSYSRHLPPGKGRSDYIQDYPACHGGEGTGCGYSATYAIRKGQSGQDLGLGGD